jgi:hypothetical protein
MIVKITKNVTLQRRSNLRFTTMGGLTSRTYAPMLSKFAENLKGAGE